MDKGFKLLTKSGDSYSYEMETFDGLHHGAGRFFTDGILTDIVRYKHGNNHGISEWFSDRKRYSLHQMNNNAWHGPHVNIYYH
jgi:hypothetical protein